jgi:carboxymethylenebutenolidase
VDPYISVTQIEAMNDKLAAAGGKSKIIVYPDAGHGFFADYRPGYNRADAEASWLEATRWLKDHGV